MVPRRTGGGPPRPVYRLGLSGALAAVEDRIDLLTNRALDRLVSAPISVAADANDTAKNPWAA